MNIHSKFLVHWTGKKITSAKKPTKITDAEANSFVQMLTSIVENGLLMKLGTEIIYGKNNSSIQISIPRVCFTEVKLSQAQKHAGTYGFLGVGLNRKFVLSRYGNPVFYVQNGNYGITIENLAIIHKFVKYIMKNDDKVKALEVVLGFLKNMSDKNSNKLTYYDEMEWRILHSDLLEREGYIIKAKQGSDLFLKLAPNDIKIIVFPNHKVKKMALEDYWLKKNLFSKRMPMITTVSDCNNF